MSSQVTRKLVNVKEAAAYLCVCERTLWELSQEHQIETVRIGRAVRYDIADLNAFIDRQKS